MEPPDPSFADEFNVPKEDAVLVFDVRRAAISLLFQVHLLKVLVEAGLVAFSSAYFEFAIQRENGNGTKILGKSDTSKETKKGRNRNEKGRTQTMVKHSE